MEQVIAYVQANLWDELYVEEIANQIHMNSDYLTRLFKKSTGLSIKSYIIRQKMEAARNLLRSTSLSVGNVAVWLGYKNFSHFSAPSTSSRALRCTASLRWRSFPTSPSSLVQLW